jgi:hypothetical protein
MILMFPGQRIPEQLFDVVDTINTQVPRVNALSLAVFKKDKVVIYCLSRYFLRFAKNPKKPIVRLKPRYNIEFVNIFM